MLVKIHKSQDRKIVSICDENLINKRFEENGLQLDISEHFYKGEKLSEEKILEELKDASSINIVGKKSIEFALKYKLISKENILNVKNIPHAILFYY